MTRRISLAVFVTPFFAGLIAITLTFSACSGDSDSGTPVEELSSSSGDVTGGVSSSSGTGSSSSGAENSSSSGALQYAYCVDTASKVCMEGPYTSCTGGSILSNSCPFSAAQVYAFCVYNDMEACLDGPATACPGNGTLSDECPFEDGEPVVGGSEYCLYSEANLCLHHGPIAECPDGGELVEECPVFTPSAFCVYDNLKVCIPGPVTFCQADGRLSDTCPDFDVAGTECEDEFNDYATFRERTQYCSNGWLKNYGSVTDTRNDKTYKTVVIGNQTWMAENLNYMVAKDTVYYSQIDEDTIKKTLVIGENRCYGVPRGNAIDSTDTERCIKYGRYYKWWTALNLDSASCASARCVAPIKPKGICPIGWHIPSTVEFNELMLTVGGPMESNVNLKARNEWGALTATDKFGFSALSGGYITQSATGSSINSVAYFVTTSDATTTEAIRFLINNITSTFDTALSKATLTSVRCIKD